MDRDFNIEDYNYHLPEERIAKFPLKERSKSKLLVWKNGAISHKIFEEVSSVVPQNSLLVFNDTKVIAARLIFQKTTGAQIEIFLLHPELPTRDIAESMALRQQCTWSCMIGNKKKWKENELINEIEGEWIKAVYHDRDQNLVTFAWSGDDTFAEIINKSGQTPLPPYLKRKPEKSDTSRYQTVYSKNDGAVAAPTAGLHFTESILRSLSERKIKLEYLTLHVSAGTFKPVESTDYRQHAMHREQIVLNRKGLQNLLDCHETILAVGTTSLRILESLYWYGVLLSQNKNADFFIDKNLPYQNENSVGFEFKEAIGQILEKMDRDHADELHGETEIYIYPGYKIQTAHGLFTNFHLPKSTLLLLISTFTGQEWKTIYREAQDNNYRFLSYGDSSLLLR